ncbi:MAG: amidohydrolase family protein, partial [Lachnospiraceae bacterium]|nr:amidohydrolase family protein [Lachnospiraceae bacterium]
MLYIKGGYVIDPKSGLEGLRDILVKDDSIVCIEKTGSSLVELLKQNGLGAYAEHMDEIDRIDAQGMIVAPGLVDVHVHFRDPGFTYKEDIESGAAAATRGGFTSVVLMANTKPAVDNIETLRYVLEKGEKTGIRVYSCANVTKGLKGEKLVDMEALSNAGASGFTDDGIPILDEVLLRDALRQAARLGKPVSLHEENPKYITNNGINAGKAAQYYGIGGSPREAEISMVERDIKIAIEEETDLSIQHISTKEAVELVRQAKRHSCHIFAEATPHHF